MPSKMSENISCLFLLIPSPSPSLVTQDALRCCEHELASLFAELINPTELHNTCTRDHEDSYRRLGFNCVVKQLRFWLFKVDCEFKDCDLRVLRIGRTCVIYTLCSNNCELREKSQFAIFKLRN